MDLVVICSLVFTTIFTSVLGVDLLRNLKKNEMVLRINKIAGKEAKVKKDDKINKPKRDILRQILARAGDFSITRRLGARIDKKLEEADILLSGGEFVVMVAAITISVEIGRASCRERV